MSGVIIREDFSDGIFKFHNGGNELSSEDIQDIIQLIEWDFQGYEWDYYTDDLTSLYLVVEDWNG